MSKIVLQPDMPSLFMRQTARANATSALDVNSGFESSFNLYSMMCVFSFSKPVLPILKTMPPCGIFEWFALNSASSMKCTVVS